MRINHFDTDHKVLVIAEIGNNHEGNYALAEKMIILAAQAGADAVKFQTIVPDKLVSPSQKARMNQLKKFQLSYKEYEKLSKVAENENVLFFSTPFDIISAKFLNNLVPAFKISSGDNNFYPLIEQIAQFGKPIILSGGLADDRQLHYSKLFIENFWNNLNIKQEIAILHCVSCYPVSPDEANLSSISRMKHKLKCTIGYSDHTTGIDASIIAVALGARIVEKHFTIDKNYSDFHDHRLSADPEEFSRLVNKIHQTTVLLGNENIEYQPSEKKSFQNIRRSICASRALPEGSLLQWDDLTWLRPFCGLSPGNECMVLGKKISKSINLGESIDINLLN